MYIPTVLRRTYIQSCVYAHAHTTAWRNTGLLNGPGKYIKLRLSVATIWDDDWLISY